MPAVSDLPYARETLLRATFLQCATAFDIGKTNDISSIRLILDTPSAIKVLNTQRLIADFTTLPVQNATILPSLFSGRVQSIDVMIAAFEAADEDVGGL